MVSPRDYGLLTRFRFAPSDNLPLDNHPAQLNVRSASPAVDLARINVEITGSVDAEPVLLLHGWASSAENMRSIASGLAPMCRVYNVDLPGHGLSPPPPAPIGVPEHAHLVYSLIHEKIGRPTTIIGHSNGGRIALYMASDPEMRDVVRRLVLISPSGIAARRSAGYYVRKYTAKILKSPFEIMPKSLREFGLDWLRHSLVWKLLGSSDYRALEGVMRETFVRVVTHHLDDRISAIEVPTLLFWGTRDSAITERQMRELESKIPDAGLVVLEGAGHYGYLDDHSTFMAATRHFLESS